MNRILEEKFKGYCLVEVSGESCANCISLMRPLKEISERLDGVKLIHIEAETSSAELITALDVEKVPAILLIRDGLIFAKCYGYQPEEILELWIDAKLEEERKKQITEDR